MRAIRHPQRGRGALHLVHEMVHLWHHHEGKPSRSGYHNTDWADKMATVGVGAEKALVSLFVQPHQEE